MWICVHWLHTRLQLLRSNEGYHELHEDSQNTNVCYSCCLHSHLYKPYLIQEKHKFQTKKSIGNWFLNPVIPACYFPFKGKSRMAVILYEHTLTALFPCELRILTAGTKISWGLFPPECQYFFSVGTQCVFSFCPALNLSLRFSTILYTVLVHDTADTGIVFTKLLATFFLWWTWTKSLWPASIMFSCASEHNDRYGLYILFTYVFLNISVETLVPQNDKCWQGHPIQTEMQTGVLIMFLWVVKSYTLLEQLLVLQGTCCPHLLHPWSNQVQTTPVTSALPSCNIETHPF